MKKIILSVLVIVSSFVLIQCKSDTDKSESNINGVTSELKFEDKTLLKSYNNCDPQSENCTYIQFNYSLIENGKNKDNINSTIIDYLIISGDPSEKKEEKLTIEQVADKFLNNYDSFIKENKDYRLGWMLEVQGKPEFTNTKIISYSVSNINFLGGAHPNSNLVYLNFDRQNGRLLELSDLFSPGYEPKLNELVNSHFRKSKNYKPEDDLTDKTGLFENNISFNNNFGLLKEGIRFYYNPYEIAPYAAGPFEVLIPYSELQEIIPENSLIRF